MNLLLKPGVTLIGKLAFARKFQILSVVFLIPVAYGAYGLCSGYLQRLDAIDRERSGVAMLSELDEARRTWVSLRNEASHWKAVDIASISQEAREAAMGSWLTSVRRFEAGLVKNSTLAFPTPMHGKLVEAVKISHARLESAALDPQAIASWWPDAYNIATSQGQGLSDLSALIVRQNKLNLDPWPETYELMTLATKTLPELLEVASSLSGIGQGVIASKGFNLMSRAQLRDASAKARLLASAAAVPDFPTGEAQELSVWLEAYRAGLKEIAQSLSSVEDDFFKAKAVPNDGTAFAGKMLQLQQHLTQLQQSALLEFDARLAVYQGQARRSFIFTLAAFAALVSAAIYILLCVQFAIRRSALGVTSLADSLREGDLRGSVVLYGRDELADIGSSLNEAVRQLHRSFMNINDRTGELNVTVGDLTDQSDSSLRAVESQQVQVSIIASAATEMASTALDVARNCEQASQQAQAADAIAKVGAEQSRITIENIKGLTSNLDNAVSNLESLEAQAHQIDDVVAVIKNIADQTNLLALNAAIEAARAGEHGRGFAVVADEVRGLSTRTKESTQVISETVSALQKIVRDSVIGVQSACAQARKDVTAVVGLNDHLASISLAVEQVTGMIYQIAAAAEQQAVTADEVSGNILKIDDMTKVILFSVEQVKVATDQLDCGSRQLSGYTAAFKL